MHARTNARMSVVITVPQKAAFLSICSPFTTFSQSNFCIWRSSVQRQYFETRRRVAYPKCTVRMNVLASSLEAFFRAEYADRKNYRNVGTSVPESLAFRLVESALCIV